MLTAMEMLVVVVTVTGMLVRMAEVGPLFCQFSHWLPPFAPPPDP